MNSYLAFVHGQAVEIGEFPNQAAAETWALERYGADLEAVDAVPTASVDVYAMDPLVWIVMAGVGIGLVYMLSSKPRRRSRK